MPYNKSFIKKSFKKSILKNSVIKKITDPYEAPYSSLRALCQMLIMCNI